MDGGCCSSEEDAREGCRQLAAQLAGTQGKAGQGSRQAGQGRGMQPVGAASGWQGYGLMGKIGGETGWKQRAVWQMGCGVWTWCVGLYISVGKAVCTRHLIISSPFHTHPPR